MLSVNDLIDINYIPAENEISLQLLVDFYEEYLCKRIFIFTLRNGNVIKLFFRDATEIFHISGIDHIYEGVPMDGKRFLQEVKDEKIDLQTVENVNSAAYKDYIIRIRSMACLDTIIKNCEYLWYPEGKISESTIEVKYLLLKGLNDKNLHLGIDTYNEKRPYFSRTLLVTEGNTADKFIGKADERLRVAKLEIRNKDTDDILISIDRDLAETCALKEVRKYADEWFSSEFPILLSNYFISSTSQDMLDVWLQKVNYKTMLKIGSFDEDIDMTLKMKDEVTDVQEWLDLLSEVLNEKMSDRQLVRDILTVTIDEDCEYNEILSHSVNRKAKNEWNSILRNKLETKKSDVKTKIDDMDSYWSGKIAPEAIRKYEKEEFNNKIISHIQHYIIAEGKEMVCTILADMICEQKSVISKQIVEKLL